MFKRISIFLIVILTVLCFVGGASAAGLFIEKDAAGTYIDYVDSAGTSIMKIDDTDGVTIASYTASNTYASMTITSTTDASSLTTGSITTVGGVSITKQLYLGDDIDMSVSGTGVYDITLKTNMADALSITDGTDIIVFETTTGTPVVTITPTMVITGLVSFDDTTDTTSGTSGSLHTDGGIGIAKALYVGTTSRLVGAVTADAVVSLDDTTDTTSTTTGSLHTDGGVGIAKNLWVGVNTTLVGTTQLTGAVTVSADGDGVDVTIYGNTASYRVLFDANGDTNAALYVGADTYGILFELYGDVTGCGVFWNPTTDTNGTLIIGTTGGSAGVDVVMYGDTNTKYWKWDQSADGVVLVGTFTETGNMAVTGTVGIIGAVTVSPAAAGTFLDFVLATEWVSGTLINAACASGTTFNNDVVGMLLDFNSNVTMTTDKDVIAYQVELPALTQSAANTTAIKAFDILTAGALVQDTGAGTINWTGIDLQMPNQTQTTGTVTCIGLNILSGTYTSGTEMGISVGANTAGLDVKFFANTTGNYLLWDESADDLLLVGTATQLDVAGTTDSTSVTTGAVSIDGGLGVAKAIFVGGNISIATAKIITTTAELTLNSVDPLTIQFGGVDWLQMDEAAIAAFVGAADTAGHAVYIESEDGGADGGAGTGRAGGAVSLKTGDGSVSATATAVGGAGGALSLITGIGLTGNTTGHGGVGGAIAITAGAGGASGAGAGVGGTGGSITLTAGAGGAVGGGTVGAPGKVDIAAGLLHLADQTIDMANVTVVTTLVPGTPTGTLITGNILYVDANGDSAEVLKLPHEADADGALLVVVNTGGETITIQNDAAGAVLSLETLNTAFLVCDGTTWRGAVCVP